MKTVTKIYKRMDEFKYLKDADDKYYIDLAMNNWENSYPTEIASFDSWEIAEKELKKYENNVTRFVSNKLVNTEVYYIEEVELNEDGEEINWRGVYYFSWKSK